MLERDPSVPSWQVPLSGDSIIFALASPDADDEPRYVSAGDSVRVLLTGVTPLGDADPRTGRALFRLTWEPLGKVEPEGTLAWPVVKTRGSSRATLTGHAARLVAAGEGAGRRSVL